MKVDKRGNLTLNLAYTAILLSFLFCLATSQNICVFLHLILHLKYFPHWVLSIWRKKGLSNTSRLSNPLWRVPLSPAIFPNRLSHHSCGPLQPRTLSLSHSWSVYNHRKTLRSLKPRRGKQHFLAFSTYSIKRSHFPCSLTSIAHYCGPMQPHTLSLSHKIHAISTSNCFAQMSANLYRKFIKHKHKKLIWSCFPTSIFHANHIL